MSSWKVDDEEVKVGRQWWRALEVALSKKRLEVEERVMGKELRAELEVEEDTGKPTGCSLLSLINYKGTFFLLFFKRSLLYISQSLTTLLLPLLYSQ